MNHNISRKFGLTIGALTLLAACAGPTQTTLSDGTAAYRIECDGTASGLNYCFERAGKSCGAAGYAIVDQNGQMIAEGDLAGSNTESLIREYAADQNSILVRCGS